MFVQRDISWLMILIWKFIWLARIQPYSPWNLASSCDRCRKSSLNMEVWIDHKYKPWQSSILLLFQLIFSCRPVRWNFSNLKFFEKRPLTQSIWQRWMHSNVQHHVKEFQTMWNYPLFLLNMEFQKTLQVRSRQKRQIHMAKWILGNALDHADMFNLKSLR